MARSSVSTTGGAPYAAPVAHASLTVGTVETLYRRAGSGAPVLLLGLGRTEEAEMITRLTGPEGRRRVIVPDCTTLAALTPAATKRESAFARWLSDFLQGLGLERPAVVAACRFREELERYAASRPEELGHAVFLGPGGTSTDMIVRTLADEVRARG